MTCSIPGICSKSPTCADKHCPGKPFPTRRVHTLEQQDGGFRICNGARFPVEAEPEELTEAHKRGFGMTWDEEQVERPLEASDGAVLAVLFLGIVFLFGVPLFVELFLR